MDGFSLFSKECICRKAEAMSKNNYHYSARFKQIAFEMADLYAKKNSDYGNSFAESIDKFGFIAGAVRLSDKFNRMCSLIDPKHEQQIKSESLYDTCIDGACYFIMMAMEVERKALEESESNVKEGENE